jgi:ribokinase
MAIAVLGSINMDLVVRTPRFPEPGETLFGTEFFTAPGGKGANQAVACARLGIPTIMLGRVGNDIFGSALLDSLSANQVDTHYIQKDATCPTGTALIAINEQAENTIIVISGANYTVGESELTCLKDVLQQINLLLLQLEVPLQTVMAAARAAREHGVRVILDPAPARELPDELYNLVDIITPNETEAAILTGLPLNNSNNIQKAARMLHNKGTPQVLIKLGGSGAYWSGSDGDRFIPIFPVKAVDTVAAGDAFNGAFAAALSEGMPISQAIRWGMAGGALSTTKPGAQPSLPYRQEVLDLLQKHG